MLTPVRSFFFIKSGLRCLLFLVSILGTSSTWGQTNPTAQSLPYSQDFSGLTHASSTYPAGWQGWLLATAASSAFRVTAPTGNLNLIASSTATANSGGVHNYNGKIGLLQSGSADPAIALAINTTSLSGIQVNYDIMTIRNPYNGSTNTRINEATLQYRVGTSGDFTNLTGIEYQNNTTEQITAVTTPQNPQNKTITLPAACNNNAVVQLRWVARDMTGAGARASFAVDNIGICAAGTISGSTSICTLYPFESQLSVSGASGPGTWSSSNPAVATVDASGLVTRTVPFLAGTTIISYTVTSGQCTSTATVTMTVNNTPSGLVTSVPYNACINTNVAISVPDAGQGATYQWSGVTGPTNENPTFSNSGTPGFKLYSVTVTAASGCSSNGFGSHINNPLPVATITATPNPACLGPMLNLSVPVQASATVSWSGPGINNPTDFSTTASPPGTGMQTYMVTVTFNAYLGNCSNTGTANVTVNPQPAAPTCPSNSSTCLSTPAYALTGASPGGGAYSGPGVSAGMFNPATAGAGTHTITYTVTDGNGCTNTCTFEITVIASCFIDFSGKIKFSNNPTLGVNNATVNLTGSATGSDVSDVNGDFSISTTVSSGNFTLTPTKTINKLNGVTAVDATAIQLHVVNTTPITDLYKQVAADVNKTNSINTLDVSIITQSLLGNPAALAQFKTSWRFAPTSHTMSLPPWGFPEQRTYTSISGPQTNQDFFGIKTGDIVTAFANPANFGAGTPLVLTVADQMLEPGAALTIDLSASQLDDLIAFQFALLLDPAYLELVSVAPVAGGLPIKTDDHIGLYNRAEGEVRVAWAQPTSIAVTEATPALRVQVKVLQGGVKLSDVIQLDDSILPGLSYNSAPSESAVELRFDASTGTNDPASGSGLKLQVQPNPFREVTTVSFTLSQACEAQLRVFDVSGRELLRMNNTYPAGNNSETLRLDGVTASGVLTCELVTPFGVATRKLVSLR